MDITRVVVLWSVILTGSGCTDLAEVEDGVCGNLVIDVSEDCDGFTEFAAGTACGEPGSSNECRYSCDLVGGVVCPDGWRCGESGLCVRPTGEFDLAAESPWPFEVKAFTLGDLDADGHLDLIGEHRSTVTVRFGSGDGAFPSELDIAIRQAEGPLSLGHFDDDASIDIVVPNNAGLAVMLGQDDRTIEPVAYAPFEIEQEGDIVVTAIEAYLYNMSTEVLFIMTGDGSADVMAFLGSDAAGLALPGSHRVGDIVGEVAVADLGGNFDMTSEFALAFANENMIWVYGSSGATGADLRAELIQTLVVPGSVAEGARFADVDGDSDADLMVSIHDAGGTMRVAVAYNTLGVLANPVIEAVFDRGAASPWPLAAGDMTGNSKADYVYPEAIYIADFGETSLPGPPVGLKPTMFTTADPWDQAVLGDFNADGLVDAAVAVDDTDGIEFLINGGDTGFFNRFFADTDRPPFALQVGDFDGDRVLDVAFGEAGFGGDADGLSVVFGGVAGGPSAPISMGKMGYISTVAAISNAPSLEALDVITDLFVMSESFPDRAERRIAIMQGSSSRRMISPFALQSEPGDSPDIPRRVVVGDFTNDGIRDIVAAAEVAIDASATMPDDDNSTRSFHLWLVPGETGDGSLDSGAADFIDMPEYAAFEAGCSLWVAGDLDAAGAGVGFDEIIGLDREAGCSSAGASRLLVARRTPEATTAFAVTIATIPGDVRRVGSLDLADLDGDGDLDLLVMFAGKLSNDSSAASSKVRPSSSCGTATASCRSTT